MKIQDDKKFIKNHIPPKQVQEFQMAIFRQMILAAFLGAVSMLIQTYLEYKPLLLNNVVIVTASLELVFNMAIILITCRNKVFCFSLKRKYSFFLTSYILAKIFCFSALQIISADVYKSFYLYLAFSVIYHFGEFYFVLFCHFELLEWKSFLIYHSFQYSLAVALAIGEYFTQMIFFPNIKGLCIFLVAGVVLNVLGQFLRLGSFISAKSNFHHLVQVKKRNNHQLVTDGVYRISRHPGYLGFFLYAIGQQMLLANLISLCLYVIVLWTFFYERILFEEQTLVYFFGEKYKDYQKTTKILIPGVQYAIDRYFQKIERQRQ